MYEYRNTCRTYSPLAKEATTDFRCRFCLFLTCLGQAPFEVRGEEANDDDDCRAHKHCHCRARGLPKERADQRTGKRSASIDMLDENIRRVTRHHVTHEAAADSCNDTDKHEQKQGMVLCHAVCLTDPHDRENAESERIHRKQHQVMQQMVMYKHPADRGNKDDE